VGQIITYEKNFDITKFTIYLLYNVVRSKVRKQHIQNDPSYNELLL